jgi:hypothetical protein
MEAVVLRGSGMGVLSRDAATFWVLLLGLELTLARLFLLFSPLVDEGWLWFAWKVRRIGVVLFEGIARRWFWLMQTMVGGMVGPVCGAKGGGICPEGICPGRICPKCPGGMGPR